MGQKLPLFEEYLFSGANQRANQKEGRNPILEAPREMVLREMTRQLFESEKPQSPKSQTFTLGCCNDSPAKSLTF